VTDAAGNATGGIVTAGLPSAPPPDPASPCPDAGAASSASSGSTAVPSALSELLQQPAAGIVAPSETATTVEGAQLDPSLDADGSLLTATGTLPGATLDASGTGNIAVGPDLCLEPQSDPGTPATVVNEDSLFYANAATDTDLVVRPTPLGVSTFATLNGPQAPEALSWHADLPAGAHLEQIDSRTVAVVNGPDPGTTDSPGAPPTLGPNTAADASAELAAGTYQLGHAEDATNAAVTAVIHAPWVRDSAGTSVPATLSVDGNTITLNIVHQEPPPGISYDYPISGEAAVYARRIERTGGGQCLVSPFAPVAFRGDLYALTRIDCRGGWLARSMLTCLHNGHGDVLKCKFAAGLGDGGSQNLIQKNCVHADALHTYYTTSIVVALPPPGSPVIYQDSTWASPAVRVHLNCN
jgi:hypothetical protein